jgi:hypothetical protein
MVWLTSAYSQPAARAQSAANATDASSARQSRPQRISKMCIPACVSANEYNAVAKLDRVSRLLPIDDSLLVVLTQTDQLDCDRHHTTRIAPTASGCAGVAPLLLMGRWAGDRARGPWRSPAPAVVPLRPVGHETELKLPQRAGKPDSRSLRNDSFGHAFRSLP